MSNCQLLKTELCKSLTLHGLLLAKRERERERDREKTVFRDMARCTPVESDRCFGETSFLHLQVRKTSKSALYNVWCIAAEERQLRRGNAELCVPPAFQFLVTSALWRSIQEREGVGGVHVRMHLGHSTTSGCSN
jgi:hypothetical protein